MVSHKGFEYEENATKFLKKLEIVPPTFQPAGASHDQPDLVIKKPSSNKTAGCELKISPTSAGSLVIKYDAKKKEWFFDTPEKEDKEKHFLIKIANQSGALKRVNQEWRGTPAKFSSIEKYTDKHKQYKVDLAKYRDIKGEIPGNSIEHYYNRKDTWYINVGTHGFYLLGNSDPLKLNKGDERVPRFSQNAKTTYRARVQYKGSGNYQFTFSLEFSSVQKSPYNIAPITGEGNVQIVKPKVKIDCFL